jgi:zinc/manganese transport system permease protein
MIPVSVACAMGASVLGLTLSYRADLPTGPAIVLAAGALYLLSMLFGPQGGLVRRFVRARHLEG